MLITDAFGGHGGIAKFNRDFLKALSSSSDVKEILAIPRIISESFSSLPPKLEFMTAATRGKIAFLTHFLKTMRAGKTFDLIVLGHINFLPLIPLLKYFQPKAKLVLVIHGIEAWKRRGFVSRGCVKELNAVISVSQFTLSRFRQWAFIEDKTGFILPNSVDLERFKPGAKRDELIAKYGLESKRVIMTLARLDARERYKGIDEVLEVLPDVLREVPDLIYLIAGDGSDRKRLEAKAEKLGIHSNVVFTGYVPENAKADYYRLADAYVMPGTGEGFGIAYIEALACGVPVMGSVLDGSRDALLNGAIGVLVNPKNPMELKKQLLGLLQCQSGSFLPSEQLASFSQASFHLRLHKIVTRVLSEEACASAL